MVRRRDNMDCQWQLVAQADMPCLIKVRWWLFWDSTNHNLTTYDWNFTTAPLLKDDFSGEDLTQNLTDYDCLSCGYNKLPSGAINAND